MRYIESKTILSKNNSLNLYRGCSHNCIYCDARSDCYQNDDFENIKVKKDAIVILEKELSKKKEKIIVGTGSMCDPYIHLEEKLLLTKSMLELIYEKGMGVYLLTKSDLILRDIDLIEKIHKKSYSVVFMTITTYDDDLCRVIERNVCCTSKRFLCLEQFSKRNIPTGIWLTPILPFINDDISNITKIVSKCHELKVKYIILFQFGTTKRKGSEDYFYSCLDKYFPGLKEKYEAMYKNTYDCISPNALELWKEFKRLCEKYKIIYKYDEIMKSIEKEFRKNEQKIN